MEMLLGSELNSSTFKEPVKSFLHKQTICLLYDSFGPLTVVMCSCWPKSGRSPMPIEGQFWKTHQAYMFWKNLRLGPVLNPSSNTKLSSAPPTFRAFSWLNNRVGKMYLQFYINDNGDKVYTTKKESPLGLATQSAHPARFSPDDKYSSQRYHLKKRFGLLPTQQSPLKY